MAITPTKPQGVRDWRQVGETIAVALLEGAALNAAGVVSNLRSLFGAETLAQRSNDEKAWIWLSLSLAAAVQEVVRDARIAAKLDHGKFPERLKDFTDAVLPQDGEELQADHLMNPMLSDWAQRAREQFPNFLHGVAPNNGLTIDESQAIFAKALRAAAPRVYAADSPQYKPIEDSLSGTAAEGARREREWARHEHWIRGLWEREPIFGQTPESGLTLKKMYLPLRCYWHREEPKTADERERGGPTRLTAHISWLHRTMHDWLDAGDDHRLRLVTGGPGCGKSSFARAFAVEAIDAGQYRVAFIPLQRMGFTGDLKADIGRTLEARHDPLAKDGGEGLAGNPLDWLKQDERPLLLIFDGLDELTPDDTRAEELTRNFVRAVATLVSNQKRVKAVILGRPAACQPVVQGNEMVLARETLLHVAPLTEIADKTLGDTGQQRSDVIATVDPDDLQEKSQREKFWLRWAELNDLDDDIPAAVTSPEMGELNAEPLLLYLLILSGYTGDNWRDAAENRNLVYREIFLRVHGRNVEKDEQDPGRTPLSEADFFGLMECLGLAAWRGNGRTGTEKEFEALRNLHMPHRRDAFKGGRYDSLSGVAVTFYTRKDLGGDAGFEFIHKSFGEYLAARAMLAFALRQVRRRNNEDDPAGWDDIACKWVRLIDGTELTREIIRFVRDEAQLMTEDQARKGKETLTGLFNWTLRHGMPAHRDAGPEVDFRTVEARQRSAEAGLLLVLSALALAGRLPVADDGSHRVSPKWEGNTEQRDLFERLQATFGRMNGLILSHLKMEGANLFGANLIGADLSGADLIQADLRGANLCEADLIGADLFGADLIQADLRGAQLDGADLSGADLFGAKLDGADLSGADLSGADLSGADLSGAQLDGADLIRAKLSEADLRGAHLDGADLIRAKLQSAKLALVHIDSVNASFADFTDAEHLNKAALDRFFGCAGTTLPEGYERPDHWHPEPLEGFQEAEEAFEAWKGTRRDQGLPPFEDG